MTEAIDGMDQWEDEFVRWATGEPVHRHDGAILVNLPPLSDLDQTHEMHRRINDRLLTGRMKLRPPYNIGTPPELEHAVEVCQVWQDWGGYLPQYFPEQCGPWKLDHKVIPEGSLMQGYDPSRVSFNLIRDAGGPIPTLQHRRAGQWELWMSVTDMEVGTMSDQVMEARGRVLVGGLGLALFPALLEVNDRVTDVTVVEIDPDVITMMEPYTDLLGVEVVNDDLMKYAECRAARESFDYCYVDIWLHVLDSYRNEPRVAHRMQQVLRPGGKVSVWCQRFNRRYRRLDRLLRATEVEPTPALSFTPCFICGQTPRADFHGACLNCCNALIAGRDYAHMCAVV